MLLHFLMAPALMTGLSTQAPDALPPRHPTTVTLSADARDDASQRRAAMQHLAAGSRLPPSQPTDPENPDRPTPMSATNPEAELNRSEDQAAIAHFASAASFGAVGSEALLALAAAAPLANQSQRALLGMLRAWRVQPTTSQRTGEALTQLVDHADDHTAALACSLLAIQMRAGYRTPLAAFLQRATAAMPEDRTELLPAAGMAPAPGMAERSWGGNRVSRLLLLALHTGDRQLILKIAEPLEKATPAQVRDHAHFTLLGISIAAPYVDVTTARQIHGWYIEHVEGWDPKTKELTTWHCGILAVMTSLHPRLPEDLLPTYGRLREWPLLREHVEQRLGGLQRPN